MEIYDYTVEKEESGIRIDRYLAEKDSGLSRSFLQKLLKEGQITVGEKAAKSNYKVRENDRIHLEIPDSSEPDIVPEDIPLDILYEDEDVLIVNKPKGMVVHPAAGHYQGTLVNAVMAHCGDSLSGINGVGKTTILNRSVGYLEELSGEMKSDEKNGVRLFFDNPQATYIPYDVIRSYDRPLIMGDFTARMADKNVKSELDWQLYLLQRRYLDYQVNIGNKMIEMLSDNDEKVRAKAATLSIAKRRFQDMIDELFSYTRKKIDRKRNDIAFYQDGELLFPYKLSSGEKQMLVILLTVLVQDNSHCVLFMDEPEASLHIEWQQKLIAMIRELNPNVQIILTTHSPAVIMEGWLDAVTEVSDISTEADGFRLTPTINC